MSRYRAVYDSKGKAFEYENGELIWAREDALVSPSGTRLATVLGDIPEFVSPIDGTVVSGRAALREHCKKHNVVLTADLKGLPPKTMVRHDYSPEYREAHRKVIAEIINSKY